MRWWMLTIAPLIRQFSRWSNCHPLRHSCIGTRRKKPSRLAFSYASRTGGEKAFGPPLPIKAMRRACVPSPMRGRCRGAADEVVDVDDRPLIRQFSRWSNCHLPPREGFWSSFSSPFGRKSTFSTVGEKAFGSALPSNVPRLCSFPYEGKVPRSGG